MAADNSMKLLSLTLILVFTKIAVAVPIHNNSFLVENACNQQWRWVRSEFVWREVWDEVDNKSIRRTELTFAQRWPLFGKSLELSYGIPLVSTNDRNEYRIRSSNASLKYQIFNDPDQTFSLALNGSVIYDRHIHSAPQSRYYDEVAEDKVGYQTSLAMSMRPASDFFTHFNFGFGNFPSSIIYFSDQNRSNETDHINHHIYSFGFSGDWQLKYDFLFVIEWLTELEQTYSEHYFRFNDRTKVVYSTNILNPGLKYGLILSRTSQMVLGVSVPIGMNHQSEDKGVFFTLSLDHKYW